MLIFAAGLALAGCGGSDDQPEPPSGERAKPAKETQTAPISKVQVVNANLNRVVAECEERREKAKSGDVGAFSKRLEKSVRTLVVRFREAPDKRFKRRPGEDPTTMRQILQRLAVSFAQEAPRGCGAGSATTPLVRSIRRALADVKPR
jgi:hypothetical protein